MVIFSCVFIGGGGGGIRAFPGGGGIVGACDWAHLGGDSTIVNSRSGLGDNDPYMLLPGEVGLRGRFFSGVRGDASSESVGEGSGDKGGGDFVGVSKSSWRLLRFLLERFFRRGDAIFTTEKPFQL